MYRCPKCDSENLDVFICTWARLVQFKGDAATDTDSAQCHDHEWDANSDMLCRDCDHSGKAATFLAGGANA